MEVAIPPVSFLLLGEPFFDLKLGRGMAISLSLKEEHDDRKMELTISLFLTED